MVVVVLVSGGGANSGDLSYTWRKNSFNQTEAEIGGEVVFLISGLYQVYYRCNLRLGHWPQLLNNVVFWLPSLYQSYFFRRIWKFLRERPSYDFWHNEKRCVNPSLCTVLMISIFIQLNQASFIMLTLYRTPFKPLATVIFVSLCLELWQHSSLSLEEQITQDT